MLGCYILASQITFGLRYRRTYGRGDNMFPGLSSSRLLTCIHEVVMCICHCMSSESILKLYISEMHEHNFIETHRSYSGPPDMMTGQRSMWRSCTGLDRYRYRPSADTRQYYWVSVSADTYLSIGADTCHSFTCLSSQHCGTHTYSFKPIPYQKLMHVVVFLHVLFW